jgi:hypothetical protein
MRSAALLYLFTLVPQIVSGADWTKLSSPNFDLYTTCSANYARLTLENFELARDFFLRVKPMKGTSELPLTLIAFDTPREYKPYAPNEFTPAYYTNNPQHEYIVMTDLEDDRRRVAIHEYVHVLVRHSGLKIPAWLNEGMADVYSTLSQEGDRVIVGAMPRDRVYSLTNGHWMHIPEIVRITHGSPQYNESDRAGMFYAESWLLVHMLMLGDEYAAKFPAFADRVSESDTPTAFLEIYGKNQAQMERAMHEYFGGPTIGGASYKATPRKAEITAPKPGSDVEIGVILSHLLVIHDKTREAARRLEQLAAKHPESPEVDGARAYVALREEDRDAVLQHLQSAIAHGSTNWKTYWDRARLLSSANRDREAREYAEQARKLARSPEDIATIDAVLHRPADAPSPPPGTTDDPGRPTLRHRDPPPPPIKKK